MVGKLVPMPSKPSRSDEVLDADQQSRISDRVRLQFESVAPRRPAKPSRSEDDAPAPDVDQRFDGDVPEFQKFQSLLQSQSQVLISAKGDGVMEDEFVETRYYQELDSIDKLHHTTGTGFIKVTKEALENGSDLHLHGSCHEDDRDQGTVVSRFRTNPARNDWIPRA